MEQARPIYSLKPLQRDYVREKRGSSALSKSSKRPTIVDVAREAGVSITTVSRYLNQQYGSIGAETRDRIRHVIEALNYTPNTLAQGLKGNRTQVIAAVMVNLGYPFCVSIIRSMTEVLTPAGYNLLVAETGGDAERERQLLHSLTAQKVDGLVLQTNGSNNDLLERFASEIPIVLVDRQFTIPRVTSVVTDNPEASRNLTAGLFGEGYELVAYVSEALEGVSTRIERLSGYEQACQAAGREPHVLWVNRSEPASLEAAATKVSKLAAENQSIAVYTANGLILMELYPWLRHLPLKIPEQLGVATFDEPDWAEIASPSLTCIRQPTREMGQMAAKSILKRLAESRIPQKSSLKVLPSHVILRGSSRRTSAFKA